MLNIDQLAWDKMGGLLPAIVQDAFDGRVLMQAFMDREALERSLDGGQVTFYSRSRDCLWVKGETSGNFLELVDVVPDCDGDSLLVLARPAGPVCHLGNETCFDASERSRFELSFLARLERVIAQRERERPDGSYTVRLLDAGVQRIAQKVGEEAVETALAGAAGESQDLLEEGADLLFHLLVLLRSRGASLEELVATLGQRHGE